MNGAGLAAEAARELAARIGGSAHEVAVVLGSGWAASVEPLGTTLAEVAAADLPGFAASGVSGHAPLEQVPQSTPERTPARSQEHVRLPFQVAHPQGEHRRRGPEKRGQPAELTNSELNRSSCR